jgi:hypothetical protein
VNALENVVDAPLRPWLLPAIALVLDVAALIALAIAVAAIVESDGREVSAVLGTPIVILIAWVLALGALATTALLGRSAWRARRNGERRSLNTGIAVASAGWLLLLAYWLV